MTLNKKTRNVADIIVFIGIIIAVVDDVVDVVDAARQKLFF